VLVAIPVFNEEQYVAGVLSEVLRLTDDLLVVDDGSTDGTAGIVDRTAGIAVLRHAENRGYGRSMIDSLDYARRQKYDWVITIDCDDQHEPARIPAFIERAERGDVDVVSGSRYLAAMPGDTAAPADRRQINAQITRMLNSTLDLSLTDAFCGFKAYRVEAVRRLSLSISGYAFPLQFWAQAASAGLRICELPVPLIYLDPQRHFGGQLDDPGSRLRHYLEVFQAELAKTTPLSGRQSAAMETAPMAEP
jgi:dolichol-phosphate mannosyltransferase